MSKLQYMFLDSGDGKRLEQFGPYRLIRPCSQAVWKPQLPSSYWEEASAEFTRDTDGGWKNSTRLPDTWNLRLGSVDFELFFSPFGHVGLFPEHANLWDWITSSLKRAQDKEKDRPIRILNLFAYTGSVTLACLPFASSITHLDASKGMVEHAKKNVTLNNWQHAPVRWIVDDALKFIAREKRRGNRYDAIILDPPTFGRGSKGEVFKIDTSIHTLLSHCKDLLSDTPIFLLLTCHTPGYTDTVIRNVLEQNMQSMPGNIEVGTLELRNAAHNGLLLPLGTYGKWYAR